MDNGAVFRVPVLNLESAVMWCDVYKLAVGPKYVRYDNGTPQKNGLV